MDERGYAVRVDRVQGLVEISGPDKTWVAEQLAILMPTILTSDADPGKSAGRKAGNSTESSRAGRDKSRKSGSRGRRGGSNSGKANPDLSEQLSNDLKSKLSTYLEERSEKAKDAQSQSAVIATFLLDELDWPEVTPDDLYTVYSAMGLKIPQTRSALNNAHGRKGYFSAPNDGKYRLSHKGENFARHDSKD